MYPATWRRSRRRRRRGVGGKRGGEGISEGEGESGIGGGGGGRRRSHTVLPYIHKPDEPQHGHEVSSHSDLLKEFGFSSEDPRHSCSHQTKYDQQEGPKANCLLKIK